jgi:hypothetical protein
MGMMFTPTCRLASLLCLAGVALLVASCGDKAATISKNENSGRLVGTWILKARVTEGAESPATERQMKLSFRDDQTFRAEYRGEESQPWITAGTGGFWYNPPSLTLYWDAGQTLTLLVVERDGDSILLHHGRNLAPLKDQEPEEVFVRAKAAGPTRQPS